MTSAYVYGVAAGNAAPELDLKGVADAPVRVIADGDVAAFVSPMPPGELRVRRRDLTSHLRVLEEAFATSTIVPCAFGMLLPSEEAVRDDFLRPRREELLALLQRLDGFVQLNVRASYDEAVVLREIVEADPEIRHLRDRTRGPGAASQGERIRLGELVAAALEARRESDRPLLMERLAAEADDVAPETRAEELVLKAAFLVARKRLEAFDGALDAAARDFAPRLLIDSIGPLPPTAFASLEQGRWES